MQHLLDQSLVDILSEGSAVAPEALSAGLKESKGTGTTLGKALIHLGALTEDELLRVLSEHLNLPYLKLSSNGIDAAVISHVPAKLTTHYSIMPVEEQDGQLTIAVSDPLDFRMFDELKLVLGRDFSLALATEEDIAAAIKRHYGIGAETVERMLAESDREIEILGEEHARDEDIEDEAVDASVVRFVNQIMADALKARATDIHLEPFEDQFRIRYRIDGLLHETTIPPTIRHFQSAIVSRVKIMASLNIAEKRLPQDGRIKIRMGDEVFDLRVSILPTSFGEGINIRILTRTSAFLGLEALGVAPRGLRTIEALLKMPHGMILVTGPTGSGKTTTLYACLSIINSIDRKILTIEDPIEYQLKGICQMQVAPKIEFTFSNALRSMLRHDPDIIMVGEIRDLETAEISIRAALTGHLVFSTLHTNDAAGAVARLLDMGIEPYLAASAIEALIAQRLVRVVCRRCRQEFSPDDEARREIGVSREETKNTTFYRGTGCEECRHTGYRGRTGIYEILLMNDSVRELLMQRVPASIIKETALKAGMRSLRQDGWEKVKEGRTTVEEVLRVTQEDGFGEGGS